MITLLTEAGKGIEPDEPRPLLSISPRGKLLYRGAKVEVDGHVLSVSDRYLEELDVENPVRGLNGETIRHVRGWWWTEFEGLHLRLIEAAGETWWDCLELPLVTSAHRS